MIVDIIFNVLQPHVYKTASKALTSARKQSQSVIVSGESGAGKVGGTKQTFHVHVHCVNACTCTRYICML